MKIFPAWPSISHRLNAGLVHTSTQVNNFCCFPVNAPGLYAQNPVSQVPVTCLQPLPVKSQLVTFHKLNSGSFQPELKLPFKLFSFTSTLWVCNRDRLRYRFINAYCVFCFSIKSTIKSSMFCTQEHRRGRNRSNQLS